MTAQMYYSTCPQCQARFPVKKELLERMAICGACGAEYRIRREDADARPDKNKRRTRPLWIKADGQVNGPLTRSQISDLLKSLSSTQVYVARSENGPWSPIEDGPPPPAEKTKPATGQRHSQRRKNRSASSSRKDEEWDDVAPYIPHGKRRKNRHRSRVATHPQDVLESKAYSALCVFVFISHIQTCVIAAYALGVTLAMLGRLVVLCAEVFIPFQHSGESLVEEDLAIAGCAMGITGLLALAPVFYLYRIDGRWISYILSIAVGAIVAAVITSVQHGETLSAAVSWMPIITPMTACGVCIAVYGCVHLSKPSVLAALAYLIPLLFLATLVVAASPNFGINIQLDHVPVFGQFTSVTAVLCVGGIVYQNLMAHILVRRHAVRFMDATTREFVSGLFVVFQSLSAFTLLIIIFSLASDSPGWFSVVGCGTALTSLATALMVISGINFICTDQMAHV